MATAFPLDSKVRFTQERLSVLTPRDRQGLLGRIGVIQTDENLTRKPTVYFSADGTHLDLRLFRVDPRHIELVDSPPDPGQEPPKNETETENVTDTNLTEEVSEAAPVEAEVAEPDGGGNLSQSELDKLFG